jgi:hypothetical protein
MKCAVGMALSAAICIASFIKIGENIQTLMGGGGDSRGHRRTHSMVIS